METGFETGFLFFVVFFLTALFFKILVEGECGFLVGVFFLAVDLIIESTFLTFLRLFTDLFFKVCFILLPEVLAEAVFLTVFF